jgi:hypothetical protein
LLPRKISALPTAGFETGRNQKPMHTSTYTSPTTVNSGTLVVVERDRTT